MAADGAREWVSPHYNSPGIIFVLNASFGEPGVFVTVQFFTDMGKQLDELTQLVPAGTAHPFVSHVGGESAHNWVKITAKGEVFPWGITPVSALYGEEEHGFAPMTFYRLEPKRR